MTNNQPTDNSRGPRIYVASLSDYNEGRLHGVWIDANQSAYDIEMAALAMLKASPSPLAEEWAIHDYEGFAQIGINEHEDFQQVSALAELIVKHGEAFAAWCAGTGDDLTDGSFEEAFLEAYEGAYASLGEFAQHFAEDDLGVMAQYDVRDWSMFQQPDDLTSVWPFTCIDWERAGRELVMGGDVWTSRGDDGVFVFRPS